MTKKKPRNFFARKKDIVAEKKKLVELKRQRREMQRQLKSLMEMYKLPEDLMKRLPASAFQNLPLTGQKSLDDEVSLFQLRENLREEHKEQAEKLNKLVSDIKLTQIELALAKIRCMEKELDTKPEEG